MFEKRLRTASTHHKTVHASLNVVLKPLDWCVQSKMTLLDPGMHLLAYWLCAVSILEVDESKTVTGAMLEVYRTVNEVELTADDEKSERQGPSIFQRGTANT